MLCGSFGRPKAERLCTSAVRPNPQIPEIAPHSVGQEIAHNRWLPSSPLSSWNRTLVRLENRFGSKGDLHVKLRYVLAAIVLALCVLPAAALPCLSGWSQYSDAMVVCD